MSDGPGLTRITERLERVSAELAGEVSDQRAAELIHEASELAAEAGRELEAALRAAAEAQRAD